MYYKVQKEKLASQTYSKVSVSTAKPRREVNKMYYRVHKENLSLSAGERYATNSDEIKITPRAYSKGSYHKNANKQKRKNHLVGSSTRLIKMKLNLTLESIMKIIMIK